MQIRYMQISHMVNNIGKQCHVANLHISNLHYFPKTTCHTNQILAFIQFWKKSLMGQMNLPLVHFYGPMFSPCSSKACKHYRRILKTCFLQVHWNMWKVLFYCSLFFHISVVKGDLYRISQQQSFRFLPNVRFETPEISTYVSKTPISGIILERFCSCIISCL